MAHEETEVLPRWDLSTFYGKKEDPIDTRIHDREITLDIVAAHRRATVLQETYEGKNLLASLDGDALAAVIAEYEKVDELLSKVKFFFRQALITNLQNEAVKEEDKRIKKETIPGIESKMLFIGAEIKRMDEGDLQSKMVASQALNAYKPWLDKLRAFRPYQLSDARERELHASDYEDRGKWVDAFEKKLDAMRYPMPNRLLTDEHVKKYDVKDKTTGEAPLTYGDLKHYIEEYPIEEAREAAMRSRGKVQAENIDFFIDTQQRLAEQRAAVEKERGFKTLLSSRNINNEVEDGVIDRLIDTVHNGYADTSHRYYKLKAQLLEKDKLNSWDVFAPPPNVPDRKVSWEEAKTTVLNALQDFSPGMADAAREYFDNGWIDAEPRAGKASGAFCEAPCRSANPALLMNFQGKATDIMTLAHELGHGINMVLTKKRHSQLMADVDKGPMTTGEVPSTLVQEIVFQALFKQAKSDDEKIKLLMEKIEDTIGSVVRQTAYHTFEANLHEAIRRGETPDKAELGKMWLAAMREGYGPAVKLDESFSTDWSRISHFIKYPFYVHAYAFADLMTGNIYNQMKQGKVENFPEKIVDLYTDLTVKHHTELMKPFGLDARDPSFWENGMDLFRQHISELEELVAKKRASASHQDHAEEAPRQQAQR